MNTLSIEENYHYLNATLCHIFIRIYQPFIDSDPNFRNVRDHDHITGKFIDTAHDICNRLSRVVYEIPVMFHNFREYDSHLINHAFAKYPNRELNVIGQTMEKYMQIVWEKYCIKRFSFFLNFSLDLLVKLLIKSVSTEKDSVVKLNNLNTIIAEKYNDGPRHPELQLLTRKCVFPYEYIDSYEKLNEVAIPYRMDFCSTLTQKEISILDYEHAKNVWNVFKCKSLKEYLYLYLLCDVLLLANVMENCRLNCLLGYDLDFVYYVSSPRLALNAIVIKSNLSL